MTERSNYNFPLWNSVFSSTPTVFWLQVSMQAPQLTYDQLWSKSIALFFCLSPLATHFSCTHPNKCKNALHCTSSWKQQGYLGTALPEVKKKRSNNGEAKLPVDHKVRCGKMITDINKLLWAVEGNTVVAGEIDRLERVHIFISEPCSLIFPPSSLGEGGRGRLFFSAWFLSFRQGPNGFSCWYQLPWSWEWQF